jgi:hypothetical protein
MNLPPHVARWALDREARQRAELMFEDALRLTRNRPLLRARVDRNYREYRCEPISTAIGLSALLFNTAGAIGVGISVGAASAIGGALLSIGASVALSAASALLQRKNQEPLIGGQGVAEASSPALSQAIRKPTVGPIPDQRLALGTVTTSGIQCFLEADPPYLWYLYLLASHECGDLKQMLLRGEDVPLSSAGFPLAAPFYDGTTRYLEVSYRAGTATQAIDPIIARDFPTMPTTFRQRRHATVCIKANYGANDNTHRDVYGSDGTFNPLFRYEGASYIDTRAAGCLIDDETTWVRGENASLNIMRALYHPWPNTRMLDTGKIDWDLMAEAADIDDLRIGLKDGTTEANHTCNGVILSSADPVQWMRELLTSNDGLLICDKGKYSILPGHAYDPVGTIDQDMLAGGFEMHTETPDRELINVVKTEFIDPTRDYKPVVGPTLQRADLAALDGQPLETTLTLPFTQGNPRAQRLATRKLNDSRGTGTGRSRKRAITVVCNLRARKFTAGKIVNVDWRDFPHCTGTYQVTRNVRDAGDITKCQLDLIEFDKTKYQFHAPTEQQDSELDQSVLDAEAA